MYNPFDGVKPSLGPFASVLQSPIGIIIGLVWALALAFVAIRLVGAIAALAKAHNRHQPDAAEAAMSRIAWPAVALIGLVLVPVIYAVLVNIGGN